MEGKMIPEGKITWVRIDNAENGWIVEWTERHESKFSNYEDSSHVERKRLFELKEVDDAFNFFKELKLTEWKDEDKGLKSRAVSGPY